MPEPIFNKTQVPSPSSKNKTSSRSPTVSSTNSNQSGEQADLAHEDEGQLSLDVYETPGELIIVAPIAGVKMADINLSVTEDILTIQGERRLELPVAEEDYLIQECFWGNFSRSIVLPNSVDTTKITANFKDGVLKIAIPRTERNKIKLIKIKAD